MLKRFSPEIEQRLMLWQQLHIVRPLDVALLRALPQSDTLPEAPLLLLMLASAQVKQGHVSLQLAPDDMVDWVAAELREDLEVQHELVAVFGGTALQQSVQRLLTEPHWVLAADHVMPITPPVDAVQVAGDSVMTSTAPFVLWQERIYLWRYFHAETKIKRFLRHAAQTSHRLQQDIRREPSKALVQQLFADDPSLPNWQKLACALALGNQFCVITGGPGTGKTTTVLKLVTLLLNSQPDLQVVLAAPTGKAAARLTESIAANLVKLARTTAVALPQASSLQAKTVHRLLKPRMDGQGFYYNAQRPLPADVVIVDEASMLDLSLFADLVVALPSSARLVLLGDKDQLASVEAGAIMAQLCSHAEQAGYSSETAQWLYEVSGELIDASYQTNTPVALHQQVVMLRQSHRFSSDSGIGQLAKWVNAGDAEQALALLSQSTDALHWRNDASPLSFIDWLYACWSDYFSLASKAVSASEVSLQARQVAIAFNKFQMLCALRQGPHGSETVNLLLEQRIRKELKLHSQQSWYAGRAVIVLQNDYNSGLMNGDVGFTLQIDGVLRVAFLQEGDSVHWFLPGHLPSTEPAYALTVHKSQGSEYQHVALYVPPFWSAILTRELIYTAITRAKQQFVLCASDENVVKKAIDAKVKRSGGIHLD